MSRPLRNTDPEKINLVTIRTENAQLLLRPDEEVNSVLGGIVAKYQEAYGIILYAYIFLGNHYHLLVKAPQGNLWRFAQALNREIAKRVNWLRKRRGHFWQRRYDAQIVLEKEDALEALLYVLSNPTHHGLVDHPKLWPGVHSYWHIIDGEDREYLFTNYTEYRKAKVSARLTGKQLSLEDFQTKHSLALTPLPQFEHLSLTERNNLLLPLLEERIMRIRKEKQTSGEGFLGRKNILKQHPSFFPTHIKRTPRPLCYTKSFKAKKIFIKYYLAWEAHYREASKKFRQGNLYIQFPRFSIRPPLLYTLNHSVLT